MAKGDIEIGTEWKLRKIKPYGWAVEQYGMVDPRKGDPYWGVIDTGYHGSLGSACRYIIEAERLADVYFQIRRGEVQGILDPDEVTSLLNRWQSLVFMLDSGSITVDVLTGAVNQLEDAFDEASSAANVLNMALAAIGVTGALGISTAADRAAGMKEQIRALYWEAVRVNEIKDQIGLAQGSMFSRAMTQADTAGKIDLLTKALEDNTLSFEERLRKQEQLTTYQVRLGEEQKAALEKNTSALERARGAFESAIRQVPGLFGLSEVTSEQLRQARMGIPQNFADDYIRRLTDEVVNGVDWAGVDIADAARRAGLNPAGNPAVLLEQVRQAWESGAFFADPANLELINQDAIANFLEQQRRQQLGQKNITDFLAGQGFAGLFGEEGFADLGTPIAQQLATALPQAISDSNVGQNSIQAIQNDILNPDILGPRTTAIGMGIAAGIFAGFGDGLDEYAWADAIMNRVYEDLAERNARGTGPY